MNDSQKYIKNLIFGNDGGKVVQNTPTQYNFRQKQYLADRTARYSAERAYLSSDFVKADIQGLLPYFYDYKTLNIRLADIITPSASTTKKTDDYKQILIPDRKVDYLPIGAKINTMGSTWLVVNPSNISSVVANAVVARCNATYNSYDYYGNIIVEPIVVEKYTMSNNDNDNSINLVLMDGYFNITCQLNENTQKLGINKRIILGDKPYHITGFTDFIQEFTYKPYTDNDLTAVFHTDVESGELLVTYPKDYSGPTFKMIGTNLYQIGQTEDCIYIKDGVIYLRQKNDIKNHLITFTARIDEPTINDDLIIGIADGKNYVVSAEIDGQTDIIAGTSTIVNANFLVNGKKVESNENYPLNWIYSSDNEVIAKVNNNGKVMTYNAGIVTITATLSENPNVKANITLNIVDKVNEPYIDFDGLPHDYISQYSSETFSATYFENNLATNYPLKWTFSGATKRDYNAIVSDDGKSVTIECLSASEKPLKITANYNGVKASIKVNLVGY